MLKNKFHSATEEIKAFNLRKLYFDKFLLWDEKL